MSEIRLLSMNYLAANLAALQAIFGRSVGLPDDSGRVRVENAPAAMVLHLATAAGRSLALNSRRDPVAEAVQVVDAALAGRAFPSTVVVLGLGLGFIIDAVEKRCPRAKVLALEPEPACVRPLLERRDWTELLSSGRLLLLWGPDYPGWAEGWRLVDGSDDGRLTIVHPVLSRQFPAAFETAGNLVERMVFGARSNAEARKKFAGRYLLNTLRNLPTIARSGDVGSLFGAFNGVPGIIISAGPSLDRNIGELREVADRAVLIAADTALRPLLNAGVQPHLVVAVDPSEANGRHLQDLPDVGFAHLVAEGSIEPAAFDEFQDRVFTFKVSDHHPWPWFREHGLDRATLRAWGSVATSAFDLALRLGCDPVVFAGQDLAFTGGQPYCRGTTFEFDWADLIGRGSTLDEIWRDWLSRYSLTTVTDIHGCTTETTPALVAFRDWLAEQCAQQGVRRFINATGAGILMGNGLQQASLEMVIPRRGGVVDVPAVVEAARLRCRPDATPGETDVLREAMKKGLSTSLVEIWRDFTVGTATLRDIDTALGIGFACGPDAPGAIVHLSRHGLAAMKQLRGLDPRCALPSSALRRQRVAAIGAAATAGPEGAVRETALEEARPALESAPELLYAATEALCRLLSLDRLATGLLPGFPPLGLQPSASVSLTAPFDWVPAARTDVDLLERLVRIASRRAPVTVVPDDSDRFRWSVPPSTQPRPEATTDATVPVSLDAIRWWARRALVVEWATLLKDQPDGHEIDIPAFSRHLAGWLADLADGPFPVALDQSSVVVTGRIHTSSGPDLSFRFDLCTPPWRLMRGLTGAIAPIRASQLAEGERLPTAMHDSASEPRDQVRRLSCSLDSRAAALPATPDPRTRFLAARHGWIVPSPLDLPPSFRLGTLGRQTAIVTPFMANRSVAVADTGVSAPLPEWPRSIVGEVHGRGGDSVAWSSNLAWYLMRRRGKGGDVELTIPPFRPTRAVILDDGTSFWGAQTGGLWRWSMSGELTCVAATPPIAGLCLTPQGLRLDPNPVDPSSRWQRGAIDVGWMWRFDLEKLEPFDLPTEGPMWKRDEAGDRWAAAHPAADLIRIGDRDGAMFDVACEWPVDLAWAGGSLLAATGHGSVLLFQNLASRVR